MSELTLMLIRFAYLAILWIFVLSAVSVVRSDMFGARVEPPRAPTAGRAAAPSARAGRKPAKRPRGAPTHVADHRGRQRRRDDLPRPGPAADRPRHRRRDPARRRLRLHPPRPDRQLAATSGSSRTSAPPTAPTSAPSGSPSRRPSSSAPDPDRQDDPRAEEVGAAPYDSDPSEPPLRRAVRRRPRAQGQPGLRLRRRAPARHRRRGRRRRARRHRQQHRRPDPAPARRTTASDDLLEALAGAIHRAHDRLAELVEEDPELEGTSTTVTAALFDGTRIGVGHVGDSRGYLLRDGELTPAHQGPHLRAEPHRRGPDHRGGVPHPPAPEPDPARGRRGARDRPRPVHVELAPGDRILLCSDGCSGVLDDDRLADILGTGTVDYAVVELVRASLDAGSTDNVTCVVADVVDATAPPQTPRPRRPPRPARCSSARPPSSPAGPAPRPRASSAATAAATPARWSRSRRTGEPVDPEELRYAPRPPRRFAWLRRVVVAGRPARCCWPAARWPPTAGPRSSTTSPSTDAKVAIFRGIQADLPGLTLSASPTRPASPCESLPEYRAEQVRDGITADDLDDARRDRREHHTSFARMCPEPAPVADPQRRAHRRGRPRADPPAHRQRERRPTASPTDRPPPEPRGRRSRARPRPRRPTPARRLRGGHADELNVNPLRGFTHRRRRGAELFLLILSLLVGVGAYVAVGARRRGRRSRPTSSGTAAGSPRSCIVCHVVVRVAGAVRRPGAAADRRRPERPRPGDDPPDRPGRARRGRPTPTPSPATS